MTTAEIVAALQAVQKVGMMLPAPVGAILAVALDLAAEIVQAEAGDSVEQLEELRALVRAGTSADWQKHL